MSLVPKNFYGLQFPNFGGLGPELWDPDAAVFLSGTYAWAGVTGNTIANVGNELQITYVDSSSGAVVNLSNAEDLIADLVVGVNYILKIDAYYSGGGSGVKLRVNDGSSPHLSAPLTGVKTTCTFYFTAQHATNGFINLHSMGASNVVRIDNLSLKRIG